MRAPLLSARIDRRDGDGIQALVASALVGTERARTADTATGTPVDGLTERLSGIDAERALLLRAGAWAIYQQAGQVAERAPATVGPHQPESRPACPPRAVALMEMLFSSGGALLPEALERLDQAGWRLPHTLLPQALGRTDATIRARLLPVLGERGRWLAQFNEHWSWAARPRADTGDAGDAPPDDAETIWQEGAHEQRVAVLRRLRPVDPATARAWLEGVWRQEKADMRADLVGTLKISLSTDDVPFLEQALNDRNAQVREKAATLLTGIPSSALAVRMRERARSYLIYADGALDAKPPAALDEHWRRDGLPKKAPSGIGERAYWLMVVLRRVPPSWWERHFSATPEALIAATAGSTWRIAVVKAWTDAAVDFEERSWATPLWTVWQAATPKEMEQAQAARDDPYRRIALPLRDDLYRRIARLLSPGEREAQALAVLADPTAKGPPSLGAALAALPMPWSEAVGNAYVAGLRAYAATLTPEVRGGWPWGDTLSGAALALPPSCFAAALEPIKSPESGNWYLKYFWGQVGSFANTLRVRAHIREAIPLP
jgi:hypothetical protein